MRENQDSRGETVGHSEIEDRVRREVIFLDAEESPRASAKPSHKSVKLEAKAEQESVEEAATQQESAEEPKPRAKTIWQHVVTGSILTSGAMPYYRYLIAIAVMCFVSIFLTFMSLNADREYRRRSDYASVLRERAVLMEEKRYALSSKSAVVERLEEFGIEMVDLSNSSRLVER